MMPKWHCAVHLELFRGVLDPGSGLGLLHARFGDLCVVWHHPSLDLSTVRRKIMDSATPRTSEWEHQMFLNSSLSELKLIITEINNNYSIN